MEFGGLMDKCLPCTAAAQLVGCCNECKLSEAAVSSLCVKGNCKPDEDVPADQQVGEAFTVTLSKDP